jgi:ubiquinone/menaquinone biosynthesis C-methylase UbiE
MALRPIDPAPGQRVLELGCGTGAFWEHNLDRVPADWDITISDWQDDMVAAARDRLDGRHPGFAFTKLDANAITRADGCFDTVLFFHLGMSPGDRSAEMQRVLRPGGRFYMSTVGQQTGNRSARTNRRPRPDRGFP